MVKLNHVKGRIFSQKFAQMKASKNIKGFTLIELLVVIAIIAILAVVVVLTLNPAQLLAQSRDSNRVSDFATLKSAIALEQVDVSSTSLGTAGTLYAAYSGSNLTTANLNSSTSAPGWGYNSTISVVSTSTSPSRVVTGGGWIPINFSAISSGSPFGSEPIDPLGTGSNTSCAGSSPCTYTYLTNGTQYKLAAKMESTKYQNGGSGDVETGDGGNSTTTFEAGTNVGL